MANVKKIFIFLLLAWKFVYADIDDLSEIVKKISASPVVQIPPELPVFKLPETNYREVESGYNLFDQARLTGEADSDLHNYNLSQLQMVGYMHYLNVDYAFLKSPYETLKVKVGDKILNGKVVVISQKNIQIDELQVQGNKVFTNKLFLNLDQPKTKNLPKLQAK